MLLVEKLAGRKSYPDFKELAFQMVGATGKRWQRVQVVVVFGDLNGVLEGVREALLLPRKLPSPSHTVIRRQHDDDICMKLFELWIYELMKGTGMRGIMMRRLWKGMGV